MRFCFASPFAFFSDDFSCVLFSPLHVLLQVVTYFIVWNLQFSVKKTIFLSCILKYKKNVIVYHHHPILTGYFPLELLDALISCNMLISFVCEWKLKYAFGKLMMASNMCVGGGVCVEKQLILKLLYLCISKSYQLFKFRKRHT